MFLGYKFGICKGIGRVRELKSNCRVNLPDRSQWELLSQHSFCLKRQGRPEIKVAFLYDLDCANMMVVEIPSLLGENERGGCDFVETKGGSLCREKT